MDRLNALKKLLDSEINKFALALTDSTEINAVTKYILGLGGKRIRPLLVLLANDLFEGKNEDAIPSAIAVELFHNFTLIHDDIMDNAPLRRGNATVHEKWNTNTAILSGDAMMIKAYELLSKTNSGRLNEIMNLFSKTALEVCEGQEMDMAFEKKSEC